MHLAIVSPFPPAITGIGQYGYHVARSLADTGAFSRLTVLAGAPLDSHSPDHLGPVTVEYCWQPGRFNARSAILARLKQLQPDLVWFNLGASVFGRSPWTNLSGLSAPLSVRRMGYPTVITLHELVELTNLRALDAPGGRFASLGARLLTSITTQADVVCLTMQHYTDWLAARRIDCVHIPIGAYHDPQLLTESDAPRLLFFTTLAPYKGLELLLQAFQIVRANYPDAQLWVAGTAHTRFPDYARQLRRTCDGAPGVHWLGQVAEDDVQELFQAAQIIVLPYSASTGSSSVLYQAATWGRAVVTSDIPEMRALARENDLQVELFASGDVHGLSNAISALLSSAERRHAQAMHNLAAMRSARPEETSRHYIQAFNRALEKRKSTKRIPLSPRIKFA